MMNITLYKATELAMIERYVDAETGEVDMIAFESAQLTRDEKQIAVVAYAKSIQVRKAMVLAAIDCVNKPLNTEYNRLENQERFYENYLLVNMQAAGITKIESNDGSFKASLQNNPPSVIIDDETLIPLNYFRELLPPPPVPNKSLMMEIMKNGVYVPGARLEVKQRLVIK